jgi:hypothetical protein
MQSLGGVTVTLHRTTWLLLTFHDYRCSLLIITLMFYQGNLVSKCLITHIRGIWAIILYILWYTVELLCWLNILSCTSLEYPLVPYSIVHMCKSTTECCSSAFAEAGILDIPLQSPLLINTLTELCQYAWDVTASWYLWVRLGAVFHRFQLLFSVYCMLLRDPQNYITI